MLDGYINSLCEPGCSHAHGAWADGHHHTAEFIDAVNREFKKDLPYTAVHKGFYRVLRGVMHFTNAKGRGASPVTWVEW